MSYEDNPDAPYSIQIEFVEGCNLRCNFCGLNGIRGKDNDYKFMTRETVVALCDQIKAAEWDPRIEIAMHGEPTMHPDWLSLIDVIRGKLPRASIMMTTNGGGLLKGGGRLLEAAFDAGLNCLAFDEYEGVKIGAKLRQYVSEFFDFEIGEYPADKSLSVNKKWDYRARQFVFVQDLAAAAEGNHAKVYNHAGAGGPLVEGYNKRCTIPFREISVRWDGNIALCCVDWRGVYKCGNIHKVSLGDMWSGPEFTSARRYLYHGKREMSPCRGCDYSPTRAGFLPDRRGKLSLPEPSARDARVWRDACADETYTVAVLRPWEKK